jgi:hypothetical protein
VWPANGILARLGGTIMGRGNRDFARWVIDFTLPSRWIKKGQPLHGKRLARELSRQAACGEANVKHEATVDEIKAREVLPG